MGLGAAGVGVTVRLAGAGISPYELIPALLMLAFAMAFLLPKRMRPEHAGH